MREEKLGFGIVFRIGICLLPILFGYSLPAMIWCSFNLVMSFIVFGPLTFTVSSLCAVCISMFFSGFLGEGQKVSGLFLALQSVFCAGACIWTYARRKSFFSGVWLASIGYLVPMFMDLRYAASKAGMSVAGYLIDAPINMIKSGYEMLRSESLPKEELADITKLAEMVESFREPLSLIVPSILILSSILIGYIIMWCVNARMKSVPTGVEHSFSTIRVPRSLVAIIVIAVALIILDIDQTVFVVCVNIVIVLMTLCGFAGISFVDFYLRKNIASRLLRIIVYFAAVMISPMALSVMNIPLVNVFTICSLIALVDSFFDFRKLKRKGNLNETETR